MKGEGVAGVQRGTRSRRGVACGKAEKEREEGGRRAEKHGKGAEVREGRGRRGKAGVGT